MKTKQIVIVDVDRGRVSYDLYEVRDVDRRSHGEVIDDEAAESVIERLNAYFGARAIVARHVSPSISAARIAMPCSARATSSPAATREPSPASTSRKSRST